MTLHKLLLHAYQQCNKSETGDLNKKSMAEWKEALIAKSLTFKFWDMIMRLQTLVLIFVIRDHRERNFSLYVAVLEELTPTFFSRPHELCKVDANPHT